LDHEYVDYTASMIKCRYTSIKIAVNSLMPKKDEIYYTLMINNILQQFDEE